jgi:type II secretory pathway component PulC
MATEITPEERLLGIIENPNIAKKIIPSQENKLAVVAKQSFKDFSAKALIAKLKDRINLHNVSRVMLGVCLAVTLLWVFDFVRMSNHFKGRFLQAGLNASAPASYQSTLSAADLNYSEALELAKNRNIFNPQGVAEKVEGQAVVQPTDNFKLVGIMWSSSPQAMIEDTKEQKTYLLGEGESVGQSQVKKIMRDKVILVKDGNEWQLM